MRVSRRLSSLPSSTLHTKTTTKPPTWDRYNTYLQCLKDTDGDKTACWQKEWLANSTCPVIWLNKWKEMRQEGGFPGVQAPLVDCDDDDE